ncbi:hypothetical protein ACFW04_008201 [Cataglyphis niger]
MRARANARKFHPYFLSLSLSPLIIFSPLSHSTHYLRYSTFFLIPIVSCPRSSSRARYNRSGGSDRSGMMTLTLTGLNRRDGSLVGSADDHHTCVENGSSGSGRTGGTHDDGDGGNGSDGGSYDDVDDAVRGGRDDNGGGGSGGDDDGGTTSDVSVSVN